ncbi:MAG: M23 family metallopeptidase [Clostridia bacterium]|nr:M23 family metallopeptidase [Clostridia bacterium]
MKNNVVNFLKRNLSYIVVALCILAVGLSVVFVMVSQKDTGTVKSVSGKVDDEPKPVEPDPQPEQVSFILPVESYTDVELYTETMSYNSTLKRFSSHMATDFFAAEGTPVYAVYGGVVEKVENSLLKGFTVVIDHGNGLKTVYNSLEDADEVTQGKTVAKGELIGRVSVTNRQESKEGAHLHFEVIENGVSINPSKYLAIDEK